MQHASSKNRIARQFDLLLWRLFGHGSRLREERALGRRLGLMASLFALFGVSFTR